MHLLLVISFLIVQVTSKDLPCVSRNATGYRSLLVQLENHDCKSFGLLYVCIYDGPSPKPLFCELSLDHYDACKPEEIIRWTANLNYPQTPPAVQPHLSETQRQIRPGSTFTFDATLTSERLVEGFPRSARLTLNAVFQGLSQDSSSNCKRNDNTITVSPHCTWFTRQTSKDFWSALDPKKTSITFGNVTLLPVDYGIFYESRSRTQIFECGRCDKGPV